MKNWLREAFGFVFCVCTLCTIASAADVTVDSRYIKREFPVNAGGGFDYLPDGDGLAIEFTFGAAKIVRVDLNGDGIPASPETLHTLPAGAFGSFIRVSPDGTFAIFGDSGTENLIRKIDLVTRTVSTVTSLFDVHDAVFLNSNTMYLSANDGGGTSAQSDHIYRLPLNSPLAMKLVASIADSPSGPVVLNNAGDLYYVKSTWAFGDLANSHRVLRFSSSALADAFTKGIPLIEADSEINLVVNSGYNIGFDRDGLLAHEVVFAGLDGELSGFAEGNLVVQSIAVGDHRDSGADSFSSLATHKNKIGFAVSTNFYSTYSLIELEYPLPLPPGDPSIDPDHCPLDPNKTESGICGCGIVDADSDGDGIFDCDDVCPSLSNSIECLKPSWVQTKPRKAKLKSKKGLLTIDMSKQANVHYEITVKALAKGGKKWKTNVLVSDSNILKTKRYKRKTRVKVNYRIVTNAPLTFNTSQSAVVELKVD